ncbi:MAG: hypothetical protein NTZ74_16305 [Chloroflexi bacterium]|nr:hypothetical protein [Chloroflexota bacterium]
MKAILTDESVVLYSAPEEQSLSLMTLKAGSEFELGKVIKSDNKRAKAEIPSAIETPPDSLSFKIMKFLIKLRSDTSQPRTQQVWVHATLPTGIVGYISGSTKVFLIKKVQLLAKSTNMQNTPDEAGICIKTLSKGTVLTAIGVDKENGKGWVRVRDPLGVEGYIRGNARIKAYQEITPATSKKTMITGVIIAGFGIALYVLSLFQVKATSDSLFITIALVLLGLFQITQGYLQHRRTKKNGNEK